jgi:S-DNA-T family DNA segregation ATPase FtsK/SpoIIIE
MAERFESYVNQAVPERPADLIAFERAAVAEWRRLAAAEVTPVECEIARAHETARETAKARFQRRTRRIEQRFRRFDALADTRHAEQRAALCQQFDRDRAALEEAEKQTRTRVRDEVETVGRETKSTITQEIWLAESVAEATRNQLAAEFKRIKEEVPAILARLRGIREQADAWSATYGWVPPELATPTPEEDPLSDQDALSAFKQHANAAREHLEALATLHSAQHLVGMRPFAYGAILCLAAVGLMGAVELLGIPRAPPFVITGPIAFLVALTVAVAVHRAVRQRAHAEIEAIYVPLARSVAFARLALDRRLKETVELLRLRESEAREKRDAEVGQAKSKWTETAETWRRRRASVLERIEQEFGPRRARLEAEREQALAELDAAYDTSKRALRERYERLRQMSHVRHDAALSEAQREHDAAAARLEARFRDGLAFVGELLDACHDADPDGPGGTHDGASAAEGAAPLIRFGRLGLSTEGMAEAARRCVPFGVGEDGRVAMPAWLALPERASLLLESGGPGRAQAIATLRAVMVRLLRRLPAGRAHFTIVDPVGLGENFAGFMHLADYKEALVGGRIWTDAGQIERQLADLSEHMENVIQKYLRNQFETIDAYNEQAGELAEPYRFLVIADFPVGFNEEAARRLMSIVNSGARCGVYTLIAVDTRQALPAPADLDEIRQRSVTVAEREAGTFSWADQAFGDLSLALDAPPAEEALTRLMQAIGEAAVEAGHVEVPFATIAPDDGALWSRQSLEDVRVPMGRAGAVRLQELRLGRGVAQHVLIAGKTGSGKSTLLHVIVTNLALWYSPDEIEFYLVDFKKGVEFKTYVSNALPHARAVAIESDREFGLSVLRRLDAEIEHRGERFRAAGVQDITAYRRATGETLPRTLLIVDEFQVFFAEDDKISQDAALLLDRLVRQGRAFGIHVLLGSQTLAGASGLARSTLGQMAVRIALQCSEADSQLILDDTNSAARLLGRPGEAIYNDAGGLVEGNSPFQVSWLPDGERDGLLRGVAQKARDAGAYAASPMIVFEGNAPADLANNALLRRALAGPAAERPGAARAWLGEAVAIKEPTSVTFQRQSGSHLMIVGQRDDAAAALCAAGMIGIGAAHAADGAEFIVFDGSPADSSTAGQLARIGGVVPQAVRAVAWREVEEALSHVAEEVRRRQEADQTDAPAVYVVLFGLQRYRMLRRSEEDFSFRPSEAEVPPAPDKLLVEILREGPAYGVHVILWADTSATLARTFDRHAMAEFDHRVLFQMSAADSSDLIDTPAANQLGFHRALYYSEEQGVLEKFRPYAFAGEAFLERVTETLRARGAQRGADETVA